MCFMLYICHSAVQLHNISVECGINYQARLVTQSSGPQKVMQPVNNRPSATILHTDGEHCICANFPVLCIVSRTASGWMIFGLPQWLSRLKLNWMCWCVTDGFLSSFAPNIIIRPLLIIPYQLNTKSDNVNSVFSTRGVGICSSGCDI